MVRDHEAVNEQALALVKKLGVTPEDNDTSKGLAAAAEEKRAEPRGARRRRLRQGLCRERGRLPPDRQRRARNHAHPERLERRAEGPSGDRAEDLPGPPAARRAARRRPAIARCRSRSVMRLRLRRRHRASSAASAASAKVDPHRHRKARLHAEGGDGRGRRHDRMDQPRHRRPHGDGRRQVVGGRARRRTRPASYVIESAGMVGYFCRFHPNMRAARSPSPRPDRALA